MQPVDERENGETKRLSVADFQQQEMNEERRLLGVLRRRTIEDKNTTTRRRRLNASIAEINLSVVCARCPQGKKGLKKSYGALSGGQEGVGPNQIHNSSVAVLKGAALK